MQNGLKNTRAPVTYITNIELHNTRVRGKIMARLIDDGQPIEGTITETEEEIQARENQEALAALEQVDNPEPPEDPEDVVPEKYQGKSQAELVRMHQEAEKKIGNQGSEVGELRKLVDQYIQAQTIAPAPTPEVEDDVDWFTDPDKALAQKLDNHPTIKKMEQDAQAATHAASRAQLELKHPDYRDIMQDGEFATWIKASKVRSRLFVEADRGYDSESADELFSNWKERKALASATANADKATRKEDLRSAATGGARGSSNPAAKKKYRRSDIINLMTDDPERYQQLAPEILLAYKEKRVY